MRARAAFAAAVAAIVVPAAAVAAVPVGPTPGSSVTATLSSPKAGARPVALTLRMRLQLVCGQPGPGNAVVTLPEAAAVPASIRGGAVLVNGNHATAVSVSGHNVSVALPRRPGVTCLSIAPGTLTIVFTTRAGLGNPQAPGTYSVRVRRHALSLETTVEISA
jgi:hypothetical protein